MTKLFKKILYMLVMSVILPASIQAQVLSVEQVIQEQDQWCWIGSSLCVLKYYGDNQLEQCDVANFARVNATWHDFGSDDCCLNPTGLCNYWNYNWYGTDNADGDIEHILWEASSQVQIDVQNISSSISQQDVANAIADGRPMIVRVNSGGHFIVLHGLQGNTLYYMDPWPGEGLEYQTFSTSQVNGRSWTHTQTCLTPPDITPAPPEPATNPNPEDNTTNVSISSSLSWTAGLRTSTHKVYFGTSNPPAFVGNQATTSYSPGELALNTTYYWRIDEENTEGTTTGSVWRFTTESVVNKKVGSTIAYTTTTNSANRRADSYTMPENGTISSISIYHKGGPGQMILGIYEGETSPTNLLAKTNTVNINSQEGWQKVNLQSPVFVASGKKIWLSWVLSENAGILVYTSTGTITSRADAGTGWTSGMPTTFGTSSLANYNYSIYASYTPGGGTPQPPGPATNPNPADNATNVIIDANLSWTAGSGTTTHNVYFGTSNPPAFIGGQSTTSYNPGTLSENTTYYWKVDEVNSEGTTTGSVWSFTTEDQIVVPKTVGTTIAYTTTTNVTNRRADSYIMPENGTISSIAMYHKGGPGQMILGIYEGESSPTNLLVKTNTVDINAAEGWQKVNLQSSVYVASGKRIWLSWVLSQNAGILVYTSSGSITPRADAGTGWSSGMPSAFGSSSLANFNYSIYAEYTAGGAGTGEIQGLDEDLFSMYPNPARDLITINYRGAESTYVEVISITGAIVKEERIVGGENRIDISKLTKGIYFVKFGNKNKTSSLRKLVIQ